MKRLLLLLAGTLTLSLVFAAYRFVKPGVVAPYPPSPVIAGMSYTWSSHVQLAPGSGDWGTTWAADDHLYTAWGNGGGFGGTDEDGRVYLGFGRIEGEGDDYRAVNVWGGKDAENEAQFGGKTYSLLSVDRSLYMWRCGDTDGFTAYDFQQLYRSDDFSRTWSFTGVELTRDSFPEDDDGFHCPVFLQFGRDYDGARDDYVYVYATEIQTLESLMNVPGELALVRVPRTEIADQARYEYFAGLDRKTGAPRWSSDPADRHPVWSDPVNGIRHPAVHYNPGLGRYILTAEHTESGSGNIAVYDAPEPWGPWTTVHLHHRFGKWTMRDKGFMWVFPTKWLSADGRDFVLVFSGGGPLDSWNTVRGRFELK